MYKNGQGVPQDFVLAHMWFNFSGSNGGKDAVTNRNLVEKKCLNSKQKKHKRRQETGNQRNGKMTYENYKNGMLRVFVVLSIPLVVVTYFEYDLSFTNNFFYSVEILFQTLVIFGCIYLFSLLIIKPFIK